jgi:hypothetical protein
MKYEAEASAAVTAVHAETGRDVLLLRSEHLLRCIVGIAALHQHTHAGADRGEDVDVILDRRRARTFL